MRDRCRREGKGEREGNVGCKLEKETRPVVLDRLVVPRFAFLAQLGYLIIIPPLHTSQTTLHSKLKYIDILPRPQPHYDGGCCIRIYQDIHHAR